MIDLLYNAESNKSEIIKSIVQLLSISIGFLITRVLWKNLDFRINIYIDKDLKDRLFTKLLKTKVKALNEIKNGEIMSYFVSDLRKVTMITAKFISTGTRIIANFTIAIIMMSNSCNIKLTLISLIPVLITIVVIIFIRKRWMDVMKEAQKSFADLSEYVQESTDSIRTMKAFCGEDKQIEEFKDKNATLKKYNISVSKNQNLLFVCVSLGFGLAYAITLLYGSNLVINGKVSIGNLIAFNGYLAMLEGPVRWIPWLFGKAKKFKVSFDRLNKMFKLPEEEIDNFEKSNEDKLNGDIEIKNLTYNYPGYIETVLENIKAGNYKAPTTGDGLKRLINLDGLIQQAQEAGIEIPQYLLQGISDGSINFQSAINQMNTLLDFSSAAEKAGISGKEIPEELAQSIMQGKISVDEAINQLLSGSGVASTTQAETLTKEKATKIKKNVEDIGNGKIKGINTSAYTSSLNTASQKAKSTKKEIEKNSKLKATNNSAAAKSTYKSVTDEGKKAVSTVKKTGKEIGKGGATSVASTTSQWKSAGSKNAKSYISGVASQKGAAQKAGKTLSTSAKTGASV